MELNFVCVRVAAQELGRTWAAGDSYSVCISMIPGLYAAVYSWAGLDAAAQELGRTWAAGDPHSVCISMIPGLCAAVYS